MERSDIEKNIYELYEKAYFNKENCAYVPNELLVGMNEIDRILFLGLFARDKFDVVLGEHEFCLKW